MRFAFGRPHVFVAAVPGGAAARLAVERFTRERGWPIAASPADADLLAICGEPSGWLTEAVEVVWGQMPAPRARVDVADGDTAQAALLHAHDALFEPAHAAHETNDSAGHAEHGSHSEHEGHHGQEGHGDHDAMADHADHADHAGDEGHGGHGGHAGHHDHHMSMDVAGLPMADRGPDRDGLRLDELTVSLGPFLPAWPSGLRLRLKLQGDVAHEVAVESEPAADADLPTTPYQLAAGRLDAMAVLLDVTGADGSALRARRLRDRLLDNEPIGRELSRFTRKLSRSRLLRAATDGVADLHGSDATARWQQWLVDAQRALDGEHVDDLYAPDELQDLLTGLELGGLRIAVASLVPTYGISTTAAVHVHG